MNTFCTFQILDQAPRRRDRGEVAFDLVRDLWHQLRRGQVPKDRGRVERRRTPILRQRIFFLNLKRSPINAPCQQLKHRRGGSPHFGATTAPPRHKKDLPPRSSCKFFSKAPPPPPFYKRATSTTSPHSARSKTEGGGAIRYVCNGHRLRTGGGRAGSGSPPHAPPLRMGNIRPCPTLTSLLLFPTYGRTERTYTHTHVQAPSPPPRF